MTSMTINATPYMQGSQVKWSLDIGGKKGGYGSYPTAHVAKGDSNVAFKVVILNGNGWTFAKDAAALWVSDNGADPSGPSTVPSQIDPTKIHTSPDGSTLFFSDANAKPAVTLHYTLNFVNAGQNGASSTLDPIIDNGGPSFSHNDYVWYAAGALALLVVLWLILKRKPSKPGPVE